MKTSKTTRKVRGGKLNALAATVFMMLASAVSATEYYVAPGGTGDYSSGNPGGSPAVAATKATASGDVIHLATGLYELPDDVTVKVAPGVTLIGGSDNPEETVISKFVATTNDSTNARVIYLGLNAVMRNLTSRGGYTVYQAAGVLGYDTKVHKNFLVSNCVVEHASAYYKGGASMGGVWRNCVIRNCTTRGASFGETQGSGGGIWGATLYDCVITNNTARLVGGGIGGGVDNGANSPTKAYNCLIGWNRAAYGAGAGTGTNDTLTKRTYCQLYNCTVVSNTASGLGGGAYLCTISNSVVCTNSVTRGGNNAIDGGTAAGGGVAYCDVLDSTLEGNQCQRSGAGAAKSNLEQCRIINNTAIYYGGGAFDCPLVKDCLLVGNTGDHGGAGFMGYFENCVMTNNVSSPQHGGATYNATTRNCIVVGNYATTYFAHCRGAHYGDLVYGNKNGNAAHPSGIGADEDREGETVPVVNCTVWGNLNGSCDVGRATLTNSVVWHVKNIYSAVNSFWRSGTVANQTGCISGTDKNPKFTGINGTVRLTEEHAKSAPPSVWAIRASSPCFNKGILLPEQCDEKDVLGNPRVKYGMVDMGALECVYLPGFRISVR